MITLQRDTDYLVSQRLDDNDLLALSMLDLAICKDDDFWKQRFLSRHGPIDKSEGKTWKTVYLQLIYVYKGKTLDERMGLAALGGHRDLVDFFITKGASGWNSGMNSAARGGHRDLVELFISRGADNWNSGMYGAAQGGRRDLVDFFIAKGATEWNWGMYGAALRGCRDLVDFFISKGATNWKYAMEYATRGGHQDLVDFFNQKLIGTYRVDKKNHGIIW